MRCFRLADSLVYGVFAAVLNGRPTSSNYFDDSDTWSGLTLGPTMLRAQKLIPTIFPMVFGLEIARLTRTFALYRAEQGTRIGVRASLRP